MKHPASFAICSLLLVGALLSNSCGASRKLQTVTISPATADAKDFPRGQVSFSATGNFSQPPSPTPLNSSEISWCIGGRTVTANSPGLCMGNTIPFATVDQNGVAQCIPQSQGTFVVLAGTVASQGMPDQGTQLKVFGTAQLTCP